MPNLVADPPPLLAAVEDPPPILALVVFPGATPAVGELPPPPRRLPLCRERVNEQRAKGRKRENRTWLNQMKQNQDIGKHE
jgi:hypothetical protein